MPQQRIPCRVSLQVGMFWVWWRCGMLGGLGMGAVVVVVLGVLFLGVVVVCGGCVVVVLSNFHIVISLMIANLNGPIYLFKKNSAFCVETL